MHRFIAACLLVALPLGGLSIALVDLLGARHVHRSAAEAATAAVARAAADRAIDPMAGWQDFRRGVSGIAVAGDAARHAHGHAAFERHHHDAGDTSVVALGANAHDAAASDDGGTTPTTLVLLLGLTVRHAAQPLPAAHATWPTPAADPVGDWIAHALERPPRG